MQVKLLRVIQEKEVLRLGATVPAKVDIRFIAATNRDVLQAVTDGTFRQDLYFRLNVIAIHIPPLAQRIGDVPPLVEHFQRKFSLCRWANRSPPSPPKCSTASKTIPFPATYANSRTSLKKRCCNSQRRHPATRTPTATSPRQHVANVSETSWPFHDAGRAGAGIHSLGA